MPPPAPATARCVLHPELAAVLTCSRCGAFACEGCGRFRADGQPVCARCTAASLPRASRGARFAANLVDTLFVSVPVFVAAFVGGMLAQPHADDPDTGGVIAVVLIALAFFGPLILQLRLQLSRGQSVGKGFMRLRVVRPDGTQASVARVVFLRNVPPLIVGTVFFPIALLDALWIVGERRRCLHDYVADTEVVYDG